MKFGTSFRSKINFSIIQKVTLPVKKISSLSSSFSQYTHSVDPEYHLRWRCNSIWLQNFLMTLSHVLFKTGWSTKKILPDSYFIIFVSLFINLMKLYKIWKVIVEQKMIGCYHDFKISILLKIWTDGWRLKVFTYKPSGTGVKHISFSKKLIVWAIHTLVFYCYSERTGLI